MSETEVRAHLVVDTANAGQALAGVSDGFEKADKAEKNAQRGLVEIARNFRDLYEGGRYAVDMLKGFYGALTSAAASGDSADHSIAALSVAVQGIPWSEAMSGAQRLGDELDSVAQRAGVAGTDLEAAFRVLTETKGATAGGIALARHEVEQMAVIGGHLGKSVEGIAREVGFMEEGMLRTRGQMFQLLQSTGIFNSDIKKAKEEWAALSEGGRAVKIQQALGQLATKFEGLPKSFKQTEMSFASIIDMAKEKVGEPFLEALKPFLIELTQFVSKAMPTMVEIAKSVASILGPLFLMIKGVLVYWVANKAAMAVTQGLPAASKIGESVVGALSSGSSVAAGGLSGAAAGLGTAGAVGLLATSAAMLYDSISGLVDVLDNLEEKEKNHKAMLVSLEKASQGSSRAFKEHSEILRRNAEEMVRNNELRAEDARLLAQTAAALQKNVILREREQNIEEAKALDAEREKVYGPMRAMQEAMADYNAAVAMNALDQQAVLDVATKAWLDAYNSFSEAGEEANTAVHNEALRVLAGSKELQTALFKSGGDVGEGMRAFKLRLEHASSQFGGLVPSGSFAPLIEGIKGMAGKRFPSASMFGPTTINIKQEFREQDPERIALVFRKDLQRAAERRYGAMSPFGTSGT
jgi:hypothetical protein